MSLFHQIQLWMLPKPWHFLFTWSHGAELWLLRLGTENNRGEGGEGVQGVGDQEGGPRFAGLPGLCRRGFQEHPQWCLRGNKLLILHLTSKLWGRRG